MTGVEHPLPGRGNAQLSVLSFRTLGKDPVLTEPLPSVPRQLGQSAVAVEMDNVMHTRVQTKRRCTTSGQ